MTTFSLADAKANLGRLIELVEAGEEVTIARRGQPVVRLVSPATEQRLPGMAALRSSLPGQTVPAAAFVRQLRDTERY
jgi:prevent-host-death family protein